MSVAPESVRYPTSRPPATALQLAAGLFGLALALESVLHLFLYLRPNPFGRPFALDPANYVFHAIYYGAWAQAIVATPCFAWAHRRARRGLPLGRTAVVLQITACTVLLVLGAMDRECQRFLGMHLDLAWLRTYFVTLHVPDVILQSLATDRGGAWSSLWGLGVALAYVPLAIVVAPRMRWPALLRRPHLRVPIAIALLVVPTVLWIWVPGGKHRQAKVRPVLLSLWHDSSARERAAPSPDEIANAVAIHQTHCHETTWVPLIVHGADARLPRGVSTCVASHVDLAPTIAELAGVWDDQSYVGHSLLDRDCAGSTAVILRLGHWAFESDDLSLYQPRGGALLAYAGGDLVQAAPLADIEPTRAIEAGRLAAALELLMGYTVDNDLVSSR